MVGVDQRRLTAMGGGPLDIAVAVQIDLPQLMQDIVQLLPQTREVFVVMGTAPLEQFWEQEIRREWPGHFPQLTFHWMSDRSLEETLKVLSHPPPHSAVFYGILNRDAAGVPHEGESGLLAVRQAAGAPLFGYSMEQLGQGVLGGRLISMRDSGMDAAGVALEILQGTAPESLKVQPRPPSPPTFDWRELNRWHIPESRLPLGSTVLYREPSLWQTHRGTVLAVLTVGAAQTALILMLLAARRQAREGHAAMSLATDASGVGFWRRETDSDEIQASPKWREIFGLPERGVIRVADVLQRIHPEDEPRVREAIEASAREGRRYEFEHRVVLPDGSTRWVASMGRADDQDSAQKLRTRGISMDISHRKGIESQMERQRSDMAHLSRVATLGELSGALAHELNQPLGSILANAQAARRMMDRERFDLTELREILEDIISEDRRAGKVIVRLKALLKRGEAVRQETNINTCVEDVLAVVRGDLASRGIQVARELEQPLREIHADCIQIQQVLLNLITNACDAMESSPADRRRLTVRTYGEDQGAHLEVIDRGAGISGNVDEVFRPFHTTKTKGLGLGLAICKTIIESHGGRLWAESNPEGGAIFHVTLPFGGSGS